MHAIFFGMKRAYQRSLAIARPLVARFGLTSARFDMLYVIEDHQGRVLQSHLRRILGVTAPTVSKMLRSLELLGLITRRPCPLDRRQRLVELTREGLKRIRRAIGENITLGAVDFAVECALSAVGGDAFVEIDTFESMLRRVRKAYHDGATLHYPWHPDD